MTGIELAAKSLLSVGARPAIEYAKRQEGVIKLLKSLKLAPDVPPADFQSLYAYALVEYCYGMPAPVINFFRNEYVRKSFRKSFETGDAKYLNAEADEIKQWNDETGALGRIDYDFRRDLAGFTAVFDELVSRSRSMSAARQERKIDTYSSDMQEGLANLYARIAKLPTLSDVQALTNRDETPRQSGIETLWTETKAWFDAIGYRFERIGEPDGAEFEWIVNVPARRRYDRILVLGVAAEITLGHVDDAMELSRRNSTDEAWIVSPRRISRAAQEKCSDQANRVTCFTLDTLIDLEANFDPYLDWLDREIEDRKISERYVSLGCVKEEVDERGRVRSRSKYEARDGGVEEYVEAWLADVSKEHLSILGEFGTGKSWFCLHYAWTKAKQYREAKRRGLPRPRLPLLVPLRDYAKAVSVESLFSEFFFRKHEINLSGYSAFEFLNKSGRLLLIFDGFDEMAARVDRQSRINNFWELARAVSPGAKVLLTCRSEHFPEAAEGRALLGAKLLASTQRLTGEPPQFEVIELLPFDDIQVREMLSHLTNPDTVGAIMNHSDLLDLMRRPVMSELVLDALPEISSGASVDISRVYLYAVRRKMARDISAERTFTSMSDKLFFLAEISWEMLGSSSMSLNYREFPDRIRACFGNAVREQRDLDHWHHDMLGQSLLIRNNAGDYSPAHRSFLEFFVAFKVAAQLGILSRDFMTLIGEDSIAKSDLAESTWTSWFRTAIGQERPPISRFATEPFDVLVDAYSDASLDDATAQLLIPMLDMTNAVATLHSLIARTVDLPVEEKTYIGGFLASLLVRLDSDALAGLDLSGIDISGARLDLGQRARVSMANSSIQNAKLLDTDLENVDFRNSDLRRSNLENSNFFGRDRSAGTFVVIRNSTGGVYVGTGDGRVLLWGAISEIGNVPPRCLVSTDVGVRELEFFGDTNYLIVARDSAGYLVVDADTGETVSDNREAYGVFGIDQQNFVGIGFTGPASEREYLEVLDLKDFESVGRVAIEKSWYFGYHSTGVGGNLSLGDNWMLFTIDVAGSAVAVNEIGPLKVGDVWSAEAVPEPDNFEGAYTDDFVWIRSGGVLAVFDVAGDVVASWNVDGEGGGDESLRDIVSGGNDWWLAQNSRPELAVVRSFSHVAAIDLIGRTKIWGIEIGEQFWSCTALTPDRSRLVAVDRYGGVSVFDAQNGQQLSCASILTTFNGARIGGIQNVRPFVIERLKRAGAID